MAANIISLSGSSASGKSSIQKEIQKIMKTPYIRLGIDQLFDAVIPDEHNLDGVKPEYFDQEKIRYVRIAKKDGHQIIPLFIEKEGEKIIQGMIGAFKAYADAGCNIVMDYIQYDLCWTPALKKALQEHKVYWIGIKIPLSILEEREKKRGTSPIGHARAHYDDVHKNIQYDLCLDTSKLNPQECAKRIKGFVESK